MICTLIRAAEINDKISDELQHGSVFFRDAFINRMMKAAYELGKLAASDTDNQMIYAEMSNVMNKIRNKV